MPRLLALMVIVAAAATVARVVVYGWEPVPTASSLEGYILLSAFAGGVALAFSRPFLLVLVPFLTVLFGDAKKDGPRAAICFLGAFALAFIVAISGVPRAIATLIYQSEWLVDPAGGVVFLVGGLLSAARLLPPSTTDPTSSVWAGIVGSGPAGVLGATTGGLMYHELDPAYDSVFFFTANAVAASHAPLTVAVFSAGLGLPYVVAGGAATTMASRARWARRILRGGRMLSGIATALIGVAVLTHRFGAIRALLF